MNARVLVLLVAVLVVGSAAAATWWNHGGKYAFGEYGQATAAVRLSLYDADSARFRSLYSLKAGVVCGMVNAKNRFGAYAGYRLFEYDNRHGLASVRIRTDADSGDLLMGMMWQADCGISP